MANETKKYASLENLQTFKEKADSLYATQKSLDDKADSNHTHTINNITDLESSLNGINSAVSQKSQVQIITWEDDD